MFFVLIFKLAEAGCFWWEKPLKTLRFSWRNRENLIELFHYNTGIFYLLIQCLFKIFSEVHCGKGKSNYYYGQRFRSRADEGRCRHFTIITNTLRHKNILKKQNAGADPWNRRRRRKERGRSFYCRRRRRRAPCRGGGFGNNTTRNRCADCDKHDGRYGFAALHGTDAFGNSRRHRCRRRSEKRGDSCRSNFICKRWKSERNIESLSEKDGGGCSCQRSETVVYVRGWIFITEKIRW